MPTAVEQQLLLGYGNTIWTNHAGSALHHNTRKGSSNNGNLVSLIMIMITFANDCSGHGYIVTYRAYIDTEQMCPACTLYVVHILQTCITIAALDFKHWVGYIYYSYSMFGNIFVWVFKDTVWCIHVILLQRIVVAHFQIWLHGGLKGVTCKKWP